MTSPVELLLVAPIHPSPIDHLLDGYVIHLLWEAPDPIVFLQDVGPRIRGVIARRPTPIDDALLELLPNIEIIANFGVGHDQIDVEAAAKRGIVVTNTPGVLDDEVADLAVGLLLATIRRIPQADRYVREGRWKTAELPLSASLRGRTIGILGLGNIGRVIARRLSGFDVDIAYHNRRPAPDVSYRYYDSPAKLAAAVDVLIAAVPGSHATRHLIDADILHALGPDGVLINVARGSVVDEAALVEAVNSGTILGAGLDVFEHEPDVPSALIAAGNVVLLPHVGSATGHTRAEMSGLVIRNIVAWFDGTGPISPISASASTKVTQ